jgi:hypothetical protein
MSATSQAISHWHEYESRRPLWASRLPDFVRQDFNVADHVRIESGEPVTMTCGRCENTIAALSAHMVGSWLDIHNHCREGLVQLWRCSCGPEFAGQHCRFCEAAPNEETYVGAATAPLRRERYDIYRWWDGEFKLTARMEIGSLREILRAIRIIYPHERAKVALYGTDMQWEVSHAAK